MIRNLWLPGDRCWCLLTAPSYVLIRAGSVVGFTGDRVGVRLDRPSPPGPDGRQTLVVRVEPHALFRTRAAALFARESFELYRKGKL